MQLKFLVSRMSMAFGLLVLSAFVGIQPRPASAATSPTFVRLVDASPDAGISDMFVDGTKFVENFQLGTVTDYATIPAGRHKWEMALIGKGPDAPLISQVILCDPGEPYTIAAYGTKATGLKLGLFADDNELVSGLTKVRVYHLAPNIGSINLVAGATTIVSGLSYGQGSKYVTLPAGSYTFRVHGETGNPAASVPATLHANTVESLFVIGKGNGTSPLRVITAQAQGLPGMPQTGSDPNPNARGDSSPVTVPWFWIVLALTVIGGVAGGLRLSSTGKHTQK